MFYNNIPFNIVRIQWSNAIPPAGAASRLNNNWNSHGYGAPYTEAAYVKLLSGTIGGDFEVRQSLPNDWTLMGRYDIGDPFYTTHNGIQFLSESGEMLIALHARVSGRADLENGKWGPFPRP